MLYWVQHKRNKIQIEKYNFAWLNTKETLKLKASAFSQKINCNDNRRRPKIDLAVRSKRTKRPVALLKEHDQFAASVLLSSDFQPNLKQHEANIEKVLSFLVDTGLSKHQYMLMRSFVNFEVSYNLLPSYEKILKFKTLRYPENSTVEETYAEVELQSPLDKTALSILQIQKVLIEKFLDETESSLWWSQLI